MNPPRLGERAKMHPVVQVALKMQPQCTELRVYCADSDDPRKVPISKRRNRWDLLARTLESLPWDRIEFTDKEGQVLGPAYERDAPDEDGEGEFDDEDDDDYTAQLVGKVLKMAMRFNLDCMKTTMRETRQIFDAQTKSQSELVGVMVEGLRAVQDSYSAAMSVQAASLMKSSEGGEGGDAEMMKVMQMAMLMMRNQSARPTTPPVARIPQPQPQPQPQPKQGAQP